MFRILILFTFAIKFATLKDFPKIYEGELEASYWASLAKTDLLEAYHQEYIHRKAKNVIIFVGGGMGLSTITASRILKGQLKSTPGEESKLVFENFPNTCLLKTYAVDSQVGDASATATALLSGVKTSTGVSGVNARVKKGESNCETLQNNIIISIFDQAHDAGMRTGIVTNTRLTQATPAAAYASIADKDWEGHIPTKFSHHPTHENCKDKARQLIENHPGRNLNVILGGGSRFLYSRNHTDPKTGKAGQREDGKNLIQDWIDHRKSTGLQQEQFRVCYNRENLIGANDEKTIEYLLGVFDENFLNYDMERDAHNDPSLEEMTDAAINVLHRNEHGFLLLVANGLIDTAHHDNHANMALYETLALERAIERALHLVSIDDTLIIVTADHSQALTMNGYQPRGHNIMGTAGYDDESHRAFNTLMYSTGPGYKKNRTDPSSVDSSSLKYQAYAAIHLELSHHTGEDVALYSIGPMSHLFHGTKEQSYVSHAMSFATCIGTYQHYDHCTLHSDHGLTVRGKHHFSSAPFISLKTSINLLSVLNILIVLFKLISF